MKYFFLDGISSETFDVVCGRETHSVLPSQRKYQKELPGRDGVVDFGIGGYQTRTISFPIYFEGDFPDLREAIDNISAWLTSPTGEYKRLAFEDAPNRHYMAKLTDAITFENSSERNIGTLTFECNPPWVYEDGILLSPEQIIWTTAQLTGNQYAQVFNAEGVMRFFVTGNVNVKPVVKIIGLVDSGLSITYNTQQIYFDSPVGWDGVKIDCENESITRISDNSNLFPSITMIGGFFEFAPGNAELSILGVGGSFPRNLTVVVEFEPMIGV